MDYLDTFTAAKLVGHGGYLRKKISAANSASVASATR